MGNRRIILKFGRDKATSVIRNEWSDEEVIHYVESMRMPLMIQAKGRDAVLKGTDATGKRIIKQVSV